MRFWNVINPQVIEYQTRGPLATMLTLKHVKTSWNNKWRPEISHCVLYMLLDNCILFSLTALIILLWKDSKISTDNILITSLLYTNYSPGHHNSVKKYLFIIDMYLNIKIPVVNLLLHQLPYPTSVFVVIK